MANKKTIKELKKEIKEIEKRIEGLAAKILTIENKGCYSDFELDERDKKINAIKNEIHYLDNEKKHIKQSIVNIGREKWLNKRR